MQWLVDTHKEAAELGKQKISDHAGQRLNAVIRSKKADPALQLWIRSRQVGRDAETTRKRAQAIEEDAESKRLAKRLKIAQLEADTAKTMGQAGRAEAAARVEEAKESRAAEKQRAEDAAASAEVRKHYYAAWLAETCLRWKPTDAQRGLLEAKVAKRARSKCWREERVAVPLFWEGATRRFTDVRADPPPTMWMPPLSAAQRTWASEHWPTGYSEGSPRRRPERCTIQSTA